jgi:hypothetical protein
LGADTDLDGEIDSLWVDFGYLARNAAINATAAAMIGLGPETPDFAVNGISSNSVEVILLTQVHAGPFRVALRTTSNDWDSVYTIAGLVDTLSGLPSGQTLIFSVAAVDADGVESLFSAEKYVTLVSSAKPYPVHLLQNQPNPFDEATRITVQMDAAMRYREAHISVHDLEGRVIAEIPITLEAPINEVLFQHGYHASGTYIYQLVMDGNVVATRKMVIE